MIDASDNSGADTLKLNPASGTLTLDGSLFKGFEVLTKEGDGSVSQTGTLTIATSATLSAGTYTLNAGAKLVSNQFALNGGSLTGDGRLEGNADANTFTLSDGSLSVLTDLGADNDSFKWQGGTIASQIMGGGGVDELLISVAGNGIWNLDFASIFKSFEYLSKDGSGSLVLTTEVRLDTELGKVTLTLGDLTLQKNLYTYSFELVAGTLTDGVTGDTGLGNLYIYSFGIFTWKGGSVNADVHATDATSRLVVEIADIDIDDDLVRFKGFTDITLLGGGDKEFSPTNLPGRLQFGAGKQTVVLNLQDLGSSSPPATEKAEISLGDGKDEVTISGDDTKQILSLIAEGGDDEDVFTIDTISGDVDLRGSEVYGFEHLVIKGDGVVRLPDGSGFESVTVDDATVIVDGDLTIGTDFSFGGRITGGKISFTVSGYSDGSLKVYNGATYSSSTEIEITDVLEIKKGGTVEDTTVRMASGSAAAGKVHFMAGNLGTADKPVLWHGSALGDTLRFSGVVHSESSLNFGAGDDTLRWSGGLLAGRVDGGGHDKGDNLWLEFGTGETIKREFSAAALVRVSGFEKLHWRLADGGTEGGQSNTQIVGGWYLCDSTPGSCGIDGNGDNRAPHGTQLHLLTASQLRYSIGFSSLLYFGHGGALVLQPGATSLASVSLQTLAAGVVEDVSRAFDVVFVAGANLILDGVSASATSATLNLAGGDLRLLGNMGVYLQGDGRYVSDASGGNYSFELAISFADGSPITLSDGTVFTPDSRLLYGSGSTLADGALTSDKAALLTDLAALFTRVRAYEGAKYRSGDVTVAVTAVDENAVSKELKTLTLTLSFAASAAEQSGGQLAGSSWSLWDSLNDMAGGNQETLERIYNESLSPDAYAALSEDLARYQLGTMEEVLARQQEQVDSLSDASSLHDYRDRKFSGWTFASRKNGSHGDSISRAEHEFNGVLEVAGVVMAINQNSWLGAWLGASQLQRKHDVGNATAYQANHSYRGVWSGVYGEHRRHGVSVVAMLAHSQGKVESNRQAKINRQTLIGEGEFDLDVWHAQVQVNPVDGWQWQGLTLRPNMQLRYHHSTRGEIMERLVLQGNSGDYLIAPATSAALQGVVGLNVSRSRAAASERFSIGVATTLAKSSDSIKGYAQAMPLLSSRDTAYNDNLYYLNYHHEISLTNTLQATFSLTAESDFLNYSTQQTNITLRQSF